ncbi:MAG: PAS domain S-box protein, partial [Candidatus Eremiobacteraeota bacterium]|nr:PAS domain S-box protein [Candidatus Eremiobacteraeota bacterium]
MLTEAQADQFLDLPYPAWVFDTETLAFLAVNDAAIAHYGYSRDRFLEMTLLDIRPGEDVQRVRDIVSNSNHQPSADGPWRHITASGDIIFVETLASSVIFDGRPARVVLIVDITQRITS